MKHAAIVTAAGFACAAALSAAPAQALNGRSFVSGHGLDTNACTLTAPCRTFQAAFNATAAGGEIDVLDPAGYGPLTITKAISIVNDGVGTASILVPSGGIGILVNAGTNDAVSVRGLTIEGAGVGLSGIQFNAGQSLTVENCVIRDLTGNGIGFVPNGSDNLSVSSTLLANNNHGINVEPGSSAAVTAVFTHVEVSNNANEGIVLSGINGTGSIKGAVFESVAAHNGDAGFLASSTPGHASATLTVFHSVAVNNGIGLEALGTGTTVRFAESVVTGNVNGWLAGSSGVVLSAGDSTIEGNTSNEAAPTLYNKK